ncbi:serine hydrolase domain-containing protein [Chloroflexota bacterium]
MSLNKPHIYKLLSLCLAITMLIGCASPTPETPPPSSAPSWPVSTPEEQGLDSEILAAMLAKIEEEDYKIDSVLVVRNGYLVLDAYVHPFRPGDTHNLYSVTKSVLSALIGIVLEQDYIESLDQHVLDFFPDREVKNLDDDKADMTLEHLLTMTSGLECRDSYLYNNRGLEEMHKTDDWIQYVLDLPMETPPGTKFEYCNGASMLLSAILQEATGVSALEYAQEYLFGPLGLRDVQWYDSPNGITVGYSRLHMRPQDMAKIGYLYLKNGFWNEELVVPSEWVAVSTRTQVPAGTLQKGYGYHWWVAPPQMFLALGYGGQFVFVIPEKDMVVAFTSSLEESDFYVPQELLNDYILPGLISSQPLPENPDADALLMSVTEELAAP